MPDTAADTSPVRRGRRPRRSARRPALLAAIGAALHRLDVLTDRRTPLPEKFAAELRRVHFTARRVLARSPAELPALVPGPLKPGAALVLLLKLCLALDDGE